MYAGRGNHYRNVVLFKHLDDWPNWVSPGRPARRIFAPPQGHVAVAAYYLWEKDGLVHGRDQAHWFRAIDELP